MEEKGILVLLGEVSNGDALKLVVVIATQLYEHNKH